MYEFKISTTYIFNDFLWIMARFVTFLLSVFVWSLSGRSDANEIVVYLIVGNLVLTSLMPIIIWTISQEIYDGSIVKKLILPTNLKLWYFIQTIPGVVKNFLLVFVVIIPISYLFFRDLGFTGNFLWLLPLIIVSYISRYFIDFIVASLTFWFTRTYGINDFQISIMPFLSGALFPLSVLPAWARFMEFNPLAFTFYHPMQIYLGKYDTNQTILVFIGGLAWCLILYFIAKLIFKFGLKRNESVGL